MYSQKNNRNYYRLLLWILLLCVFTYTLRIPFAKAASSFLIKERITPGKKSCFILSGNAYDRGNCAISLYKSGLVASFYCSGANVSNDLKSIGIFKTESDIQKEFLVRSGIPDSLIQIVPYGTSTREELKAIDSFCAKNNIQKGLIISTYFHTHRIHSECKKYKRLNQFDIRGCSNSLFNEQFWWQNEYGCIALNNEYIKLILYSIK